MSASPWVARNLDNAQFAQPRGSQYEGPRFMYGDFCSDYCAPLTGHTPGCNQREQEFADQNLDCICPRHTQPVQPEFDLFDEGDRDTFDREVHQFVEETEAELRLAFGDR